MMMLSSVLILSNSCTDLEKDLGSNLTKEESLDLVNARQLIDANYQSLQAFATQDNVWALEEHTSDEVMGPTRGGDWDDNGVWRVLHTHEWANDNNFILNTFNALSGGVFESIEALEVAEGQERGEALFLQAWYIFYLNDLFGQVAFRDNLDDLTEPSTVLNSKDAADLVIANLEEAIELLPENSSKDKANKNIARAFLAKVLLNKAVYYDEDRIAPFSFDNQEMDQVIDLTDAVINSGQYSLESGIDYFDNFKPTNSQDGSEVIFVQKNTRGQAGGNVASRWLMTLHYNQEPNGWNGFTTIADFYNKFDDNDVRLNSDYPGLTDVSGLKAGFLQGQQFDEEGNALEDRLGNPLDFTVNSPLISDGEIVEVSGVRGLKYIPDFENVTVPETDYVLLRYSDVLLTKAEALLRKGQSAQALQIVNNIRSQRNVDPLNSLSEEELLDERGRELWWEGHRRTDLIRFGKFLDAWNEKGTSDDNKVLFPIPERAVVNNPNLTQNPGY